MLSVSAAVQAVLDDPVKRNVRWLFEVTDANSNVYRWSTQDCTGLSQTWEARVADFGGITMRAASGAGGLIAPSEVTFTVVNADGALPSALDFIDAELTLHLVIEDANGTDQTIRSWRFTIVAASEAYDEIDFTCEDFMAAYLDGDYPNTPAVMDIFPTSNLPTDLCVPVIFGTAYIPLAPVLDSSNSRAYLLGPVGPTYTPLRCRSPRSVGPKIEWTTADAGFTQYSDTGYQLLATNTAPAGGTGVWAAGEQLLPMPVQYTSSSALGSSTNPADVIKNVLLDMGLTLSDIDSATFSNAASTFSTWGLTFGGGWWKRAPRTLILQSLLDQCTGILWVGDTVRMGVWDTTPVTTLTEADIQQQGLQYQATVSRNISDGANGAWVGPDESIDELEKTIVPLVAGATPTNPSDETLELPFVHNDDAAQRLTMIYFQRKFWRRGQLQIRIGARLLNLDPFDVVQVSGTRYGFGGSYPVVVETIQISPDLNVTITAGHYYTYEDA